MAPGKKTRLSQKQKVIAAKISDPELSLRDIEKQTGVKKDTVARTISEIPEIVATSLDKGASIMESIDDIIEKSTSIARKHLRQLDAKESLQTKDVKTATEIGESFFKKKQLLEGKPTDILEMAIDPIQAKKIAERYMKK